MAEKVRKGTQARLAESGTGGVIIASAPGRAGIIGNPTDGYGGSVISCSLQERAHVRLVPGKAPGVRLTMSDEAAELAGRSDYHLRGDRFDLVRAVLSYLRHYDGGFSISTRTDVPVSAGLAGSTALLVAIVAAVLEHLGVRHHRHYLAEVARVIELNYMKTQCGYQDAYMAVFGGLQYMDFRDKEFYRELSREVYATMEPLGEMVAELPAVVVHTGHERHSGSVLRPIRERWLEGDRGVVEGYRRIGQLCRQGKRALLDRDWPTLGRLMNENHAVQRELGASGPANDELVERCLHQGCWGAKLAGAGGGGHIVALHPEPGELVLRLAEDGYTRVIRPKPSAGLTVSRESH